MDCFEPGQVVEFDYPFVRSLFTMWDEGGPSDTPTWKPGVRHIYISPYGDTDTIADGMGKQVCTVVSLHKPGRYPERVFYTRKWRDPSGKEFGNGALRIATVGAFRNLTRGFRHDYRMATADDPAPEEFRETPPPQNRGQR